MPRKYHEATQSGTYALARPHVTKQLVQTARGRVLAEGDVDPAAGSRDESTRLHVEVPVAERKQAFEVQVHKVLFLKSNKGVQALPPTFCPYRSRASHFSCSHTWTPKE